MRPFYFLLGWCCFGLGAVGVVVVNTSDSSFNMAGKFSRLVRNENVTIPRPPDPPSDVLFLSKASWISWCV